MIQIQYNSFDIKIRKIYFVRTVKPRRMKTLSKGQIFLISMFNPFPHINAFWRLCSRRLFENIVTIEYNCSISPFATMFFPLFVIGYPFNYRDFLFFDKKCSKSSAALFNYNTISYRDFQFPHIDAFWHLCSRRLFKNIVTKEEIAQNVQFLLLPQCFPLLVISIKL